MDCSKTSPATKPMSAELKARLKRGSIYSLSPIPIKKTCKHSSFSTPVKSATKDNTESQNTPDNNANQNKPNQTAITSTITLESPEMHENAITPRSKINRRLPRNLSTFSSPLLSKREAGCASHSKTPKQIFATTNATPEVAKLEKVLAEKQEVLRKLKMVKMYRTKNNLDDLEVLIKKWRDVCQQGLHELLETVSAEPKPTLGQLIEHLQIDHKLIGFNQQENDFT